MIVHVEEVSSTLPYNLGIELMYQSEDALVTCMDEVRHGLEDGDYVTFTEVKGMEGLNSAEPRKVTTKGELPHSPHEGKADIKARIPSPSAARLVWEHTSLAVSSPRSRCPRSSNS